MTAPSDYRARLYHDYRAATGDGLRVEAEWRVRAPYLRHFVASTFPADRDTRIAEIGCGAGLLLRAAREAGYTRLTGIDHSADPAGAPSGVEMRAGDLRAAMDSQPPNSLDAVIAFDVLEHFRRDEILTLLDAIHRSLAAGGRLILHLPNGESPFFGRVFFGDLTHETVFTRASIRQALLCAGFSAIHCREDRPGAGKGVKGALRRGLWRLIRLALRAAIAVETGERGGDAVLTSTMVVVAIK